MTKYIPYILLAIAILSLYFEWKGYENSKPKKCGCKEKKLASNGNIV